MFENVVQGIFSATFLAAILRVATPILLPSLAALISDKAGVIHIGLEGTMLAAAFTGVALSAYAQQWFGPETGRMVGPWLGLVGGVAIGVLMALLLGFLHLRLKADLILAGIALNILGSAGTVAIMFELTGDRGSTSRLASLTMPFITLPTFIRDIPLIGGFIYDVFNNQSVMTWIAFIAVFVVWFMLYRTPFGLHLRATGENMAAAQSVGIRAIRTRYYALMLSGALAAMGGIHMSMGYLNMFQRDMTAGRGFIALATPLLGGGNPYGTAAASLMFGFFDAFAIRIGTLQIPSQVPQMIPYVATVMALVIYALQTRQTQRFRALRATGVGSARTWRTLQSLSVLHVLLAMFAVIGVILSVGLFAAPNGFGGLAVAYPWGAVISLASLMLIGVNWPFIARLERILEQPILSAAVTISSLTIYLALFLLLFFSPIAALLGGLALSLLLWAALGGLGLIVGEKLKLHVST
ncbi:MAG: ABC transporter permease [Anaerolineae bacterium]|nr:ABC transporter permease [Anaerolineae bacterium]MDW8172771.1 ABC transporter permease [Anaerolineae bacterium]